MVAQVVQLVEGQIEHFQSIATLQRVVWQRSQVIVGQFEDEQAVQLKQFAKWKLFQFVVAQVELSELLHGGVQYSQLIERSQTHLVQLNEHDTQRAGQRLQVQMLYGRIEDPQFVF